MTGACDDAPRHVVAIGALVAVRTRGQLVAYGLGSCVGVAAYVPRLKLGAMLHAMLPTRDAGPSSGRGPHAYVDTGLLALLATLRHAGAQHDDVLVYAAGGAATLDAKHLHPGKRNLLALRKALWRHRLLLSGSALGGRTSRTLRLDAATGAVTVGSDGRLGRLDEMPRINPGEQAWA